MIEKDSNLYTLKDGKMEVLDEPLPTEESIEKEKQEVAMTIYNFNKMLVAQLPTLTQEQLEVAKEKIRKFRRSFEIFTPTYYMLLGEDLRYYTVFQISEDKELSSFEDEVISCLQSFAEIKSIEFDQSQQAIEIWVTVEGDAHILYLFDYSIGVIACQ